MKYSTNSADCRINTNWKNPAAYSVDIWYKTNATTMDAKWMHAIQIYDCRVIS